MQPSATDLLACFNLPPADAIDYLQKKGFKIGWDWHETLDNAHARAFTVAKVAKIDVLQDIRKSLVEALKNGESFEQWAAKITPTLQQKGWWGKQTVKNPLGVDQPNVQLGSPRRLKIIFDNNVNSALAAGRFKVQMAAVETRPFWEWRHISVITPRKQHVALNGRVFRYDDEIWTYGYPPVEWGCQCKVIARTAAELGDKAVESTSGQSVEVKEVIGKDLQGHDVVATRRQVDLKNPDGSTTRFSPVPGWNGSPAASHIMDEVLLQRAASLMGQPAALQQVEQHILSPVRLNAHESFVQNTVSFNRTQHQTSTVGVLHQAELAHLATKGIVPVSPIVVVDDYLIVGKKATRHGQADNAVTEQEWKQLPTLMSKARQVVWDNPNQSLLFVLPATTQQHANEVIKVSAKAQNGAVVVVSAFKVDEQSIVDGIKAGQYDKIR